MSWTRPGTVVYVHDGDSMVVDIDLGKVTIRRVADLDLGWHIRLGADGHLYLKTEIRVDGINAPELATPEGKAAAEYAKTLLPPASPVTVVSKKLLGSTEKYGRILADLSFHPPTADRRAIGDFAVAMVAAGFAKAYTGRGPKPT